MSNTPKVRFKGVRGGVGVEEVIGLLNCVHIKKTGIKYMAKRMYYRFLVIME